MDLGAGEAEFEKVGELQRDEPKTNRRASRNLRFLSKSAFSASRPFIAPILKGSSKSRPWKKSWKKCERALNRKFFAIFLLLIDLRPRKQTKTTSV